MVCLFCWPCPGQESPKPGRYLCPAAGSPKTATAEGLRLMTQPWPLSPALQGGTSPSSICQATFPAKQHLPSQQHRAWLGSTAPFQHKSCTIPSSQLMQYPGFIFHPFPCFLTDLFDLLQPLRRAPKRSSFEERPRRKSSLPSPPAALPAAWPAARALSNLQSPCTSLPG